MATQHLSNVFRYLPAGYTSVWVLATPYFNRPVSPGAPCTTAEKVGLAVITGVLGLLCWIRATVALYSFRCIRHACNHGVLWFCIAILEGALHALPPRSFKLFFPGAAVTALYAAVVILTPPGSTCFLYDDNYVPRVSTFTTYNVLTAATLVGLAAPRTLDWMTSLAELFGIRVRRDPQGYACMTDTQADKVRASVGAGVGGT